MCVYNMFCMPYVNQAIDRLIVACATTWMKRSISSGSINCTFNWHSWLKDEYILCKTLLDWNRLYIAVIYRLCFDSMRLYGLLSLSTHYLIPLLIWMWVFRCGTLKSLFLFIILCTNLAFSLILCFSFVWSCYRIVYCSIHAGHSAQ